VGNISRKISTVCCFSGEDRSNHVQGGTIMTGGGMKIPWVMKFAGCNVIVSKVKSTLFDH